MARRAASDPGVAYRIATLQELRAAVASMRRDIVMLPQPPAQDPRATAWPRRAGRWAAAATIVAALIAAGWWAAPRDVTTERTAVARMIASHDAWSEQGDAPATVETAGVSDTARLMAATGLRPVHHETMVLNGASAHHTGYLGENGCRVSVFEIAGRGVSAGSGSELFSNKDGLLHASWQAPKTHFVLIARDMNSVRFATIASSLKSATGTAGPKETELIANLRQARQRCFT